MGIRIAIIKKYIGSDKKRVIRIILLTCLMFFCMTCFLYDDQILTTKCSIVFIDSILKGNFLGGYQAAIDAMPEFTSALAAYNPLTYIIIGILNLPFALIYHYTGSISELLLLYYINFQQLILIIWSGIIIHRICGYMTQDIEKSQDAMFAFLSCFGVVYYSLALTQMEIMATLFTLLGLYSWLKGNNRMFVLFFAIAIPIKLFPFLVFFPLVLIKEKNVIKIFVFLMSGLFLYVLMDIIWGIDETYRISVSGLGLQMIDDLKRYVIPGGIAGGIPIFVFLYILLCLVVYIVKMKNWKYFGIYIIFAVYALLFLSVPNFPYRIVMITPFIPLLMELKENGKSVNILIDTIFWIGHTLACLSTYAWVFSSQTIARMLLGQLYSGTWEVEDRRYVTVLDFLQYYGIDLTHYTPYFNAVYAACLIGLIIINHPNLKLRDMALGIKDNVLLILRMLIVVPILSITIIAFYSQQDKIVIDTTVGSPITAGWNLLSDDAVQYGDKMLTEKLTFNEDSVLTRMRLQFSRQNYVWYVYSSVFIELRDLTNKDVIFYKRIGYNELIQDDFTDFYMSDIEVKKDNEYELAIYTDGGYSDFPLFINVTEDKVIESNVIFKGKEVGCNLYMIIEAKP